MNAMVRLPHPWSGDGQDREMFLAPSADNQTHNYDTIAILIYIFELRKVAIPLILSEVNSEFSFHGYTFNKTSN